MAVFLFGIELELVLQPKAETGMRFWDHFAQGLSQLLLENSIENELLGDSKTPNYKIWTVAEDGTIERNVNAQKWGVELISNICYTRKNGDWKSIEDSLWRCLQTSFTVVPSQSCGTHVHVSANREKGWGTKRLTHVAKAVVYFERCVDSCMPEHRLKSPFCRSNRYNSNFRQLTMSEIFQAIDKVGIKAKKSKKPSYSHVKIGNLLCPDGRYYRWNFCRFKTDLDPEKRTSDLKPKKRTIEFRQPPGCSTAEEAIFWPQFTTAFISGALQRQSRFDTERVATLTDLHDFLRVGCGNIQDWSADNSAIDDFFKDKQQLLEGMYPEAELTTQNRAQMAVKDRIGDAADLKLQAATEQEAFNEALPMEGWSDDDD